MQGHDRMETGHHELREILTTEEEIEAILGKPNSHMLTKVIDTFDDICLAFIARSPFVIVSCDAAGHVDVSPKDDPAGFVHVIDHQTIAIPERPGNRRAELTPSATCCRIPKSD
jgi:uncharacterized protein